MSWHGTGRPKALIGALALITATIWWGSSHALCVSTLPEIVRGTGEVAADPATVRFAENGTPPREVKVFSVNPDGAESLSYELEFDQLGRLTRKAPDSIFSEAEYLYDGTSARPEIVIFKGAESVWYRIERDEAGFPVGRRGNDGMSGLYSTWEQREDGTVLQYTRMVGTNEWFSTRRWRGERLDVQEHEMPMISLQTGEASPSIKEQVICSYEPNLLTPRTITSRKRSQGIEWDYSRHDLDHRGRIERYIVQSSPGARTQVVTYRYEDQDFAGNWTRMTQCVDGEHCMTWRRTIRYWQPSR